MNNTCFSFFFLRCSYYKAKEIKWIVSKKMGSSYCDQTVQCSNPDFGKIRIASTDLNFSENCKLLVSLIAKLIILATTRR